MRVKLKADYSLEFLDGVGELNENDDLVAGIEVVPEVPTNSKEKLAIGFQQGEIDENSNLYSAKMSMYKQPDGTWQEMIPNQILKIGELWTFQIFREVYNRSDDPIAVKASTPATFTINPGIKIGDKKVTEAMAQTLWDGAVNAEQQALKYKNGARDAANDAAKSESNAASSATSASLSAQDADSKYQLAYASAANAAKSESNANGSAISAGNAKTDCEKIQASVENDIKVIAGLKKDAEDARDKAQEAQVLAEGEAVYATKAAEIAWSAKNAAETAKYGAENARNEANATAEKVQEQYDKVMQVAGSIDKALTFSTYAKAIEYFNTTNDEYVIGQSILIAAVGVPDLWIADVSSVSTTYNYVSDAQFLSDIRGSVDGIVKVGKYYLSATEAALDNYVKKTDYANATTPGVVLGNKTYGFTVTANGIPAADIIRANEYADKTVACFIGKGTLENIKHNYVKQGITTNTETLTGEEKASACEWIGAVPKWETDSIGYTNVLALLASGTYIPVKLAYGTPTNSAIACYVERGVGNNVLGTGTPVNPTDCANKDFVENLPNHLTLTDEQKAKWREMVGAGTSSTGGVSQAYVDSAVQGLSAYVQEVDGRTKAIEEIITEIESKSETWTFLVKDGNGNTVTITKEILLK